MTCAVHCATLWLALLRRVLFLTGIAVALIYCGLTFSSLSGAKHGGFRVVPGSGKSARALAEENAQLQQPQRAPDVNDSGLSGEEAHSGAEGHNHGPDEPCDASCAKHHSHLSSPGREAMEVTLQPRFTSCQLTGLQQVAPYA